MLTTIRPDDRLPLSRLPHVAPGGGRAGRAARAVPELHDGAARAGAGATAAAGAAAAATDDARCSRRDGGREQREADGLRPAAAARGARRAAARHWRAR